MGLDVIVVGASFAGLSVASQLRGRVLIVDRKPIGHGQTSACGTTLQVLDALALRDSLLQVHPALVMHVGESRVVRFDVPHRPFCTFDYAAFCRGLHARSTADFLRAEIRGLGEGWVDTDAGRLTARHVVDCGGWRPDNGRRRRSPGASFGVETVPLLRGRGLHFFLDPRVVPGGAAWVFPCGDFSRVGVASYRARTRLRGHLSHFCASLGAVPGPVHGGFFPWRLKQGVRGTSLVVGDAAGQCIPFSGEGIRPAAFFGVHAGRLLQQVIEGRQSLEWALSRYRRLVEGHRGFYRFFGLLQSHVCLMPVKVTERLIAVLGRPPVRPWIERYYLDTLRVPEV